MNVCELLVYLDSKLRQRLSEEKMAKMVSRLILRVKVKDSGGFGWGNEQCKISQNFQVNKFTTNFLHLKTIVLLVFRNTIAIN